MQKIVFQFGTLHFRPTHIQRQNFEGWKQLRIPLGLDTLLPAPRDAGLTYFGTAVGADLGFLMTLTVNHHGFSKSSRGLAVRCCNAWACRTILSEGFACCAGANVLLSFLPRYLDTLGMFGGTICFYRGAQALQKGSTGAVLDFLNWSFSWAERSWRRPVPWRASFSSQSSFEHKTNQLSVPEIFDGFFFWNHRFRFLLHALDSIPSSGGLTTLAMVLNSLRIDPMRTWKGAWRWYNEQNLACCFGPATCQNDG